MSTLEKIPVLDLSDEVREFLPEYEQAFRDVLHSGSFILGPKVEAFESEVAKYLGCQFAIGLNSGTDALLIALRSLGVGPGDEVITTAFSFFATSETINLVGATPVFVDIDPATMNIDASAIEAKITPKTKVIIPVHLFGHCADMTAIMSLAKRYGIDVVEDVAQAFSGRCAERKLGTIGRMGAYSFFPSKNLGAFGDGGLLTTDDAKLAAEAKMLRAHGSRKKYFNEAIGYNSRLDALQAAMLSIKLKQIETWSAGRRRVASTYTRAFAGVRGISTPVERADSYHVYHQYTIRIANGRRDEVKDELAKRGIETMIYYPVALHQLPVYRNAGIEFGVFPEAERASAEVLSLPIWPQMSEDKQARVIKALCEVIA
jgi:dTDP-4-amino-4,6-dideoxygalactose transaminase